MTDLSNNTFQYEVKLLFGFVWLLFTLNINLFSQKNVMSKIKEKWKLYEVNITNS